MEKRLHFNKEVDDLSKIDEFFRNFEISSKEEFIRKSEVLDVQIQQVSVQK